MEALANLWLGRFVDTVPLRSMGTLHQYACRDAETDEACVVLVGDPGEQAQAVHRRLSGIARAHRLLDHPMIPKLVTHDQVGEVELVALRCDAVTDLQSVLLRIEESGAPMSVESFSACMEMLSEPLIYAHETIDPESETAQCLGVTSWSKFLVSADGRLWATGFGDVFTGGRALTIKHWGEMHAAPEVIAGQDPNPRADLAALFKLILPVLECLPTPAPLERIFRGEALPEDQELMEKFLDFQMRLGGGVIYDRPVNLREMLALTQELWALQGVVPDATAARSELARVAKYEHATRAITLMRPIEARPVEPQLFWQHGRYRAKQLLGRGGSGTVHLAWDRELEQDVAVKTIDARRSSTIDERFVREVRLMRKLRHPHVVVGYDLIRDKDTLAAVMEYVEGDPFDRFVKEQNPDTQQILSMGVDLADALASLHEAGVVHRDVKPANVIVSEKQGPVLVDLGVALEADSQLTATGAMIGTPLYMAPEQLSGERTGSATDVYALCIMMLEAFIGQHPFDGASLSNALFLRTQRTALLDDARLPPAVAELLEQGLKLVPDDRLSAAALRDGFSAQLQSSDN